MRDPVTSPHFQGCTAKGLAVCLTPGLMPSASGMCACEPPLSAGPGGGWTGPSPRWPNLQFPWPPEICPVLPLGMQPWKARTPWGIDGVRTSWLMSGGFPVT